jgi:tRNA A37 N6-isopentenylltransferase MiaA
MTKEQARKEYIDALGVALQKRKQYTYYRFKEMNNQNLTEELLNDIADTCTRAFFSRMQNEDIEQEIKYDELWNKN